MSLLDRALPLTDVEVYVKMLLFGDPGVGKTHFAGFAPKPLFFDFEKSTETLRYIPELKGIRVFKPGKFQEVVDLTREAVKSGEFETLVFDTVSRMQMFQMQEHMREVVRRDPKRDRLLPYQQDYRISTALLDEFFLELQDLPINIILIAHSLILTEDLTSKVKIKPDLTPSLGKAVTGLINVVGYLDVTSDGLQGTKRVMYLNPTNRIVAKNRLGITETIIQEPTFKGIFNHE